MKRDLHRCLVAVGVALLAVAGCTHQPSASAPPPDSPLASDGHAAHDHPTAGPHHGDLVELGNEYHAEILHDANDTVTLYVLDLGATQQVPIDSAEVTINAKLDGKPVQFKLAAVPDTGDPEGKSSRFVTTDPALVRCLDDESADPRVVISIKGKSYRGAIAHHHDHAGHDHKH